MFGHPLPACAPSRSRMAATMRFCAVAMRAAAWGTLSIMALSDGTSSSHQRLMRQHENAVVRGFAHRAEEVRRLFDRGIRGHERRSRCFRSLGPRLRAAAAGDGRFERRERLPDVVIGHVVQGERAADARGDGAAMGPRDHHELGAALAFQHAIGLELAQRFAHGAAVNAELPRQLHLRRQPVAGIDGARGDAVEQGGGHLAVGGLDLDGLERARRRWSFFMQWLRRSRGR